MCDIVKNKFEMNVSTPYDYQLLSFKRPMALDIIHWNSVRGNCVRYGSSPAVIEYLHFVITNDSGLQNDCIVWHDY